MKKISKQLLADAVRSGRNRLCLSQAELSRKTGINRSILSNLENGHQAMNIKIMASLLDILNVSADWLLGRTVDVENSAETWADNSLGARLTRPVTRAFANPFTDMPDYAYGFKCSPENWHRIQEYDRCMQAAEAARFTLLELRG